MESMFIVDDANDPEQRTFYHDELLPSLPLPRLEESAARYLESCRPVLDDEEYKETVRIVQDFVENKGKDLHSQLEKRSQVRRNWLYEWWLDAYLTYRGPAGALNICGLPGYSFWPLDDQIKSAALQIHFLMKFWDILRNETLRSQTDAKGYPLNMHQLRYLFNNCRIPKLEKDELLHTFKTKYEGQCPSHIIIFYKKRIYRIHGICPNSGEILSPKQYELALLEIVKDKSEGQGVPTLTELPRTDWAQARSHLMELSSRNCDALKDIETAVICMAIGDRPVESNEDLLRLGMFETSGLRWMDKANYICSRNSKFITNCDHTPLDGMTFIVMTEVFNVYLRQLKETGLEKIWGNEWSPTFQPVELQFDVDNEIKNKIVQGQKVAKGIEDSSEVRYFLFTEFGKDGIKKMGKLQVHPCAFIQICLQYAYMKLHGKPASTYETAGTRTFYKGRTETLRTCTEEAVKFCKAMISNGGNKTELFVKACRKYNRLMDECKQAQGFDRHFYGLSMVATENGDDTPEIFTDAGFLKSGGGGNFVLSTSLGGYGSGAGVCMPFREDGYGAYYRIQDHNILFLITCYRSGQKNQCNRIRGTTQALLDRLLQFVEIV